jgi:hypothetical protein
LIPANCREKEISTYEGNEIDYLYPVGDVSDEIIYLSVRPAVDQATEKASVVKRKGEETGVEKDGAPTYDGWFSWQGFDIAATVNEPRRNPIYGFRRVLRRDSSDILAVPERLICNIFMAGYLPMYETDSCTDTCRCLSLSQIPLT